MVDLQGLSLTGSYASVDRHIHLASEANVNLLRVITGRGNQVKKQVKCLEQARLVAKFGINRHIGQPSNGKQPTQGDAETDLSSSNPINYAKDL